VIFVLYIGVFVACSCVLLPLAVCVACAARTQKRTPTPPAKDTRLSLPATDGVR
jgi:hypothetical protein